MKPYSIRKAKKIFFSTYHLFKKKAHRILLPQSQEVRRALEELQAAIIDTNRELATVEAKKCETFRGTLLKKRGFEAFRDGIFAIVFALAVALLIRQVWFEIYHIPSGSMRPTLKEKDQLIVSKTTFGIDIPFKPGHVYFDPGLVERGGIFVFTTENMDVPQSGTFYFFLLPGKKQFVKRMMGRPGDTLYFYGGRMYGIDQEGNDISPSLQLPQLEHINHVPIITFDGKVLASEPFHNGKEGAYRMAVLYQMNEPVARLTALSPTRFEGELLPMSTLHNRTAPPVTSYHKLWGIGNYAMAKIAPIGEVRGHVEGTDLPQSVKYALLLSHTPSFDSVELSHDQYGRIRPQFSLSTSYLPLDDMHLQLLFASLYTSRFQVVNGYASRADAGQFPQSAAPFLVRLEGVPDGTYEFFDGKAYQIYWGGVSKQVSADHPLQQYSAEKSVELFNFGISFIKRAHSSQYPETSRFAYFREGDLYLLNAPVFRKGEEALVQFASREQGRAADSIGGKGYVPFLDQGPPLDKEGKLDVSFIKRYGLLIPSHSYLALGDNYANSGDSREFGFVPQANLRGAPFFIYWPFGPRFGMPNQLMYPFFTVPNLIVLTLALICIIFSYWIHKRSRRLPIRFD